MLHNFTLHYLFIVNYIKFTSALVAPYIYFHSVSLENSLTPIARVAAKPHNCQMLKPRQRSLIFINNTNPNGPNPSRIWWGQVYCCESFSWEAEGFDENQGKSNELEAERRHKFMEEFLKEFYEEWEERAWKRYRYLLLTIWSARCSTKFRQNVSKSYSSFLFSSNMSPIFLCIRCHFPWERPSSSNRIGANEQASPAWKWSKNTLSHN